MSTNEPKTKPTDVNPRDYIAAIADDKRREQAYALLTTFVELTGEKPVMWGPSIIGFGQYMAPNGNTFFPWPMTGFSIQKDKFSLYLLGGKVDLNDTLSRLGKHTTGVSCLYVRKLSDIDLDVLREIISGSFADMKSRHTVD